MQLVSFFETAGAFISNMKTISCFPYQDFKRFYSNKISCFKCYEVKRLKNTCNMEIFICKL